MEADSDGRLNMILNLSVSFSGGARMQRRKFFGFFGGAAAWPIATHAQNRGRLPTLGVIIRFSPTDPEGQARVRAIESGLSELGLIEGRNIHIDYRWPGPSELPAVAAALVASRPDIILADGASVLTAVRQTTQSIPVVFTGISDPEGNGIVANLARPSGNMTGFANFEPSMGGKWLQTLKEIAPPLTRVGVLRLGNSLPRILQNVQTSAASATEVVDCSVQDESGLRTVISAFNSDPNAGLIVFPDPFFGVYRSTLIELTAKYRHPTIYAFRVYPKSGGLISYGIDILDQVRRSAVYVDRILKGAKPGDLPVEAPTKFELVVNLKTAKALDLSVSPSLLARADEVID
jgi:putative tryptophan/tyrosine transport system substrate-binding protein